MVNNHAIGGAIVFALPLFGFDNVIYAIILWHMYVKICDLAKKSFGTNVIKSFVGAVIVNIIVASLLELICNCFTFLGGMIGGAIIGFVSIKVSGAAYLKTLEIAHSGKVAERYTFNRR